MNRPIEVVYDDRELVNESIEAIVGRRTYGEIIHKKRLLVDIARQNAALAGIKFHWIRNEKDILNCNKKLEGREIAIIYHHAKAAIRDDSSYLQLLQKASQTISGESKESFFVIFDKLSQWFAFCEQQNKKETSKTIGDCAIYVDAAFTDVSIASELLSLLCSDFESRHFNFIKSDERIVEKSSTNLEKIRSEYLYYGLVPENLKQWFVQPFDFQEKNGVGSYRMERLHMTNVAISWLHGAFKEGEFRNFLSKVFLFLSERPKRDMTAGRQTYGVLKNKIYARFEDLKKTSLFPELESMVRSGLDKNGIEGLFRRYESLSKKILDKKVEFELETISHGDLCFSNILYNKSTNYIHLIDPRGASKEEDLWMDSYYDLAKLSHSVMGNYDFLTYGQFSVFADDELQLHLKVRTDTVKKLKYLFISKLKEEKYDVERVRIIEVSLFLSMLSLHTDNFKRILGFIINAKLIMDELEFNTP